MKRGRKKGISTGKRRKSWVGIRGVTVKRWRRKGK